MSSVSPIAQIEQGIVQRLQAGLPGVQVESYAGQLDDDALEWIRRLPAVWVTFDRAATVKRTGARSWHYAGRFVVLAAQRALRGEPTRRLGTGADAGVYQLLEDAKQLLANQTLGLAIEALDPGAITPVLQARFAAEAIAVFSQAYDCAWAETVPAPALTPEGELQGVGLRYYLKPGDDQPDAEDRVTLAA